MSATVPNRQGGSSERLISLPALFVTTFLAGAALVALGELIAGVPGFAWIGRVGLATAGPVAVMLGYFVLARRIVAHRKENTIGQVADSLYFLGFLFTLVALLSALVTLVEIDTAGIVSRFGFALVTTLAGLLAKVTLTQFTVGFDQRREHAERSLSHAVTNFEKVLVAGTAQLDQHLQSVSARIHDGVDEMLKHAGQACEAQMTCIHATGDELVRELDESVQQLAARADAQRDRLDGLADTVEASSKAALERTEAHLTGFVSEAERHSTALRAALGTALESVEAVTDRQVRFGEALDEGQRRLEAHCASENVLMALGEQTRTMCTGVVEATGRLEKRAARADQGANARAQALTTATANLVREIEQLRAQREAETVAIAAVERHRPLGPPPGARTTGELPEKGVAANDREPPADGGAGSQSGAVLVPVPARKRFPWGQSGQGR